MLAQLSDQFIGRKSNHLVTCRTQGKRQAPTSAADFSPGRLIDDQRLVVDSQINQTPTAIERRSAELKMHPPVRLFFILDYFVEKQVVSICSPSPVHPIIAARPQPVAVTPASKRVDRIDSAIKCFGATDYAAGLINPVAIAVARATTAAAETVNNRRVFVRLPVHVSAMEASLHCCIGSSGLIDDRHRLIPS
jgi:hypothetical protein